MPEVIQFPRLARLERRRIINDTSIRSIKPPAGGTVDYFDDLTPGLSLRVTSNDVRTWTVFYSDKTARQERLTLGRYPAVKLVDARELARNAHRSVAHGGDPVAEKRAAREALTFGELVLALPWYDWASGMFLVNAAIQSRRDWATGRSIQIAAWAFVLSLLSRALFRELEGWLSHSPNAVGNGGLVLLPRGNASHRDLQLMKTPGEDDQKACRPRPARRGCALSLYLGQQKTHRMITKKFI